MCRKCMVQGDCVANWVQISVEPSYRMGLCTPSGSWQTLCQRMQTCVAEGTNLRKAECVYPQAVPQVRQGGGKEPVRFKQMPQNMGNWQRHKTLACRPTRPRQDKANKLAW
jgi:hypothetical protein